MTTEKFFNYLNSLGLFRINIYITESGIESIISKSTKPKVNDFTEVKDIGHAYKVRLSKKDYFNKDITKGYFD